MDEETLIATETSADTGSVAADESSSADTDLLILDEPTEVDTEKTEKTEEQATADKAKTEQSEDDKETEDYRGLVSGRIRGLVKKAPELAAVLKKYPEVQSVVEGIFRREAAMREIFPTIAEARELRDRLPNGVQDLNSLLEETQTLETIDDAFYTRGEDGNFPGHEQMVKNFFEDDKDAAVNLFKTLPKVWAQLDRDSYNDVMGKIVGATFAQREVPEFIAGLIESAKDSENPELLKGLQRLQSFVTSYTAERKKTPEQEQIDRERASMSKERTERTKNDQQAFHRSFVTSALTLQRDVLTKHPVIQKLQAVKSLDADKKAKIVEMIRANTEQFLAKSPAFMKKLRAAYNAKNTEEIAKIQRAAWQQQWLLNRMIRQVLRKETPQLVSSNRETAARRASTTQQRTAPAKTSDTARTRPTRPYQQGNQWFWPDGRRMTATEVLQGKHL